MIDWQSSDSHLLLNPRQKNQPALNELPHISGHLWVSTSGTRALKYVALSKEAFLHSAEAVNKHLKSSPDDRWIHVLPNFHVGGLSIDARAFLSHATIYKLEKWDPLSFVKAINFNKGTLSSVVPTQVFDLVVNKISAPPSIRALIVGGGQLSNELREAARKLGWPLMLTYGMTECCSQIATSQVGSHELKRLPHVQVKTEKGLLSFKSKSLLTGYAEQSKKGYLFSDPKEKGWFQSDDCGELKGDELLIKGRLAHFVKVSGELVNLQRLNLVLQELKTQLGLLFNCYIKATPDPRLGYRLVLVTESNHIETLMDKYQMEAAPFERISEVCLMDAIPMSPLGKVLETIS